MEENKNLFSYRDSGNVEHTIEITDSSFEMKQANASIHDVKFKTKPTTFLKDAFKRFCKNKSSVVGAIILGILLIGSFTLPYAIPHDTSISHPEAQFLEPKLFDAGTGFWDGTKRIDNAVCSNDFVTEETNADSNYQNTVGYRYPSGYSYRAVLNLTEPKQNYVSLADEYAEGGSVHLENTNEYLEDDESLYGYFYTGSIAYDSSLNYTLEATLIPSDDEQYIDGEFAFAIKTANSDDYISDFTTITTTGSGNISINLNDEIQKRRAELGADEAASTSYDESYYEENGIAIELVLKTNEKQNSNVFIENLSLKSANSDGTTIEDSAYGFKDGNSLMLRDSKTDGYWSIANLSANLYKASAYTCSFTLDTYENALGVKDNVAIGRSELASYAGYKSSGDYLLLDTNSDLYKNRSMDISGIEDINSMEENKEAILASFKIVDSNKCPIISINDFKLEKYTGGYVVTFYCKVYYYRYKGYGNSMPRYLFGTDRYGKDVLKISFNGLQTSLLLGILTFIVCFTIGLILGSIEGYYGGWVDIILQRFTDILSGVPWIVVMTLCILALGSNFFTFALALCLTGWIGTSNLARTQFYRFKGREYILASRTLGARDSRLIFKHILPNSMGTIITSSVLMIPSVIFSEATISYLGLGLQNIDSLGVILSDNQSNLSIYPYTLIVPAVIIALIMISFNLFGNGLRDAFNPSLKGGD